MPAFAIDFLTHCRDLPVPTFAQKGIGAPSMSVETL